MSRNGWRSALISSPIKEKLFRVVIIGRTNTGKSTLFNRLLGRRRSITDSKAGVTRDAVEAECTIEGRRFHLVDTGGYRAGGGGLEALVSRKSLQEAEGADLILLVLEVKELTGEDQDFVERLRRLEEKLILVVNKVDGPNQELALGSFYELGFHRLIGVSAQHNLNIDLLRSQILEAVRRVSSAPQEGQARFVRLAILGKPNTGKSTLLNFLLEEEKSLVCETPGTTRDVIEGRFLYKGVPFQVLDTAGIRRKSRIEESIEYYSVHRAIASIDDCDVVFLLLDAVEGLAEQDKKIASLAVKKGRGIILSANKWDLLPQLPNQFQAQRDRIRFLFPLLDFAPVLPLSALTGMGVGKLMDTSLKIWRQLNRRVDTARLNQALKGWVENHQPSRRGRLLKIRYATQVETNPVKFVFFVNSLRLLPDHYRAYLQNRIRQDLDFALIPLQIDFRDT